VSTSEIRLREYTKEDRQSCLAVFDSNVPIFFTAPEKVEFERFLDSLPGPYFVVEGSGRVYGCGGYAVVGSDGRADLCWGMVLRSRQGTGLGRLLLEARLEAATTDPAVRVVMLNTSQLTTGFYERLGFRTSKIIPDGYSPGLDRCEMRLEVERRP
jgi:ribosomal protein S18 acetylase RimI-like enzyme